MKALRNLAPALALLLAACGGDSFDDLREYMKRTEATLPHQIDPLPAAKVYEPFTYEDFALSDPFRPRSFNVDPNRPAGANAPDLTRPREVLERYPLDALRMVGVLQLKGKTFGLIRAEGTLYRVKPGDHLGLDYGVITAVNDGEIAIRENIQDASGDWSLRAARLQLAEGAQEIRR